jgi:GT2 family glycosyltransferase
MVKTLWNPGGRLAIPGVSRTFGDRPVTGMHSSSTNRYPVQAVSSKWRGGMQSSLGDIRSCRVVVAILNWNGRQYLEPCLRSVFAQEFQDFSVILVDNGSTDGSADLVRARFPQVHLIENTENLGFAAANNQAILASNSDFVATLNNDTQVDPGWLGALVEVMEADRRVGMCASKMLFADQRDVIDSAGILVDRAGIAWNLEGGSRDRSGEASAPVPVFGPCAGAALYRRAMLQDVGLFDEDFFAYLEDVDLAWRAQWASWRCVYVPAAVVYHVHSATGREGSYFKSHLLGRNKVWALCKNYPFPQLLWYAPLVITYDLMAIGYAIAAGRGRGAVQGRIEALCKVHHMLAKRKQVVHRVSARTMMSMLHPLESPLAVLRRFTRAHVGRQRGPARSESRCGESTGQT